MTIIAYRDGVMAADTGAWRGNALIPWARKVARGRDGTLYGGSGSATRVGEFLRWVDAESGDMPLPKVVQDDRSDFYILAAYPDGRVGILSHEGWGWFHDAPYVAIGCCIEVCLGAMFAGADAETAVAAALAHGNGAGGSIMAVRR